MNVNWTDGSPCPVYISSCYNGEPGEPNLLEKAIAELDIPLDANWILAGDFNRHHSDWSARLAPSARPSQAAALRNFIGERALTVLNDPEVATRVSPDGELATLIDLVVCSPSLQDLEMEASLDVTFSTPSQSDHALLTWFLPLSAIQAETFTSNRLPRSAMKRWEAQVAPLLPAVFQLPQETREDLD